jgi:hypothetical protein
MKDRLCYILQKELQDANEPLVYAFLERNRGLNMFQSTTSSNGIHVQKILDHAPKDVPHPDRFLVQLQGRRKSEAEWRPVEQVHIYHATDIALYCCKNDITLNPNCDYDFEPTSNPDIWPDEYIIMQSFKKSEEETKQAAEEAKSVVEGSNNETEHEIIIISDDNSGDQGDDEMGD